MSEPYVFVVEGRIVPYTRTTQRSKWVSAQYAKYIASQNSIRRQVRDQIDEQGLDPIPDQTPMWLVSIISVSERLHTFDNSNALKAVEDALQHLVHRDKEWGDTVDPVLYRNDQWIDADLVLRFLGKYDEVLIVVEAIEKDADPLDFALDFVQRALEIARVLEVVPREEE